MNCLTKIKDDLKVVRMYFSNKQQFDKAFSKIENRATKNVVDGYLKMINDASLELYQVFYELYVNGKTQEVASDELGYCVDYIRKKNKLLLKYFEKSLMEQGA